jgi:hypothetical protein
MTEFEIINDILLESPHEHKFKNIDSYATPMGGGGSVSYCKECQTFVRRSVQYRLGPVEEEYVDKYHESYHRLKKMLDTK